MAAETLIRRIAVSAARRVLRSDPADLFGELIDSRVRQEPHLADLYNSITEEQARLHFGPEEPLEHAHFRNSVRYFHAWRVHTLRERIGPRLAGAQMLDVGDTDGRILKDLGKPGLGFNLNAAAVDNIRANGIEARLGDGQQLPFEDSAFDYVLCFETLEHVENPIQLLSELGRVCGPRGRVFISIPWVPRTFIHARDPAIKRGYGHIFEFARKDFETLLTHTPLAIRWDAVCDLIGPPWRPAHRALLLATTRSHLPLGMFRRFQFFELAPTRPS
jgi:SAM-dependent methyltransferase